jgi:quinol monooxygenase YgiN
MAKELEYRRRKSVFGFPPPELFLFYWKSIPTTMIIVHVHIVVKTDSIEAFKDASIANARASVEEPGIVRFDVIQEEADPSRFLLVEIYRSAAAQAAHKETAHYALWRDTVALMMAQPRTSVKFTNIFPNDSAWQ